MKNGLTRNERNHMQQIALFGNAADRFFLTLEEPPEDLEMTVTEELYLSLIHI